ncbi:MAG: hypothetical protein ABI601_18620 [bacterium]
MNTIDEATIAHHEAGHAALDIYFEHDLECVTVVADGDAAGGTLVDRGGDESLRYEDEEQSQVPFERRIMSALAGEIAQRRFNPGSVEDEHAGSDRLEVHDYLDELDCPTQEIRDAYWRLLRLRAEHLVERLWPRVEAIAALLVERKTISGDEARQAFAAAGPAFHLLQSFSTTATTT